MTFLINENNITFNVLFFKKGRDRIQVIEKSIDQYGKIFLIRISVNRKIKVFHSKC